MATCSVSLKVPEKTGRIQVEGVQLSESVQSLKKQVADKISLAESQFDLIYCGRYMRNENTVQSYGVKPGVTLHALRKKEPETGMEAEPMDEAAIQQLLTALQSALLNPAQRHTVIRILTSRVMLDNVIAATPCLQADPTALAMLQDPELLIQLADPNMIHKIVKAHPALGEAALHLAAAVNEESATSRGAASFLGFPDEEMEVSESAQGNRQQQSSTQPITSAQLAAALAAAGVGTSLGDSPGGSNRTPSAASADQSQPSTSSNSSQSAITADLFSQAMAQAMSGSSSSNTTPPTSSPSPSRPELQSQLRQLREMGITDESRCIRALQITGGNVQAALELLFDGTV
ncbi:ubiquitin-like protein 7 [Saccoglossus kowalevskii]|uniref:Ubiquitin-like protein 7-like n=1 Tax=Saccoglossus kowalevskii TaxID=10224 RepID=A0ABM0GIX7_SACKO|nr:PREDICTED: ubiquitin-like protein 7-like [Saccoglossus kowalevskii]